MFTLWLHPLNSEASVFDSHHNIKLRVRLSYRIGRSIDAGPCEATVQRRLEAAAQRDVDATAQRNVESAAQRQVVVEGRLGNSALCVSDKPCLAAVTLIQLTAVHAAIRLASAAVSGLELALVDGANLYVLISLHARRTDEALPTCLAEWRTTTIVHTFCPEFKHMQLIDLPDTSSLAELYIEFDVRHKRPSLDHATDMPLPDVGLGRDWHLFSPQRSWCASFFPPEHLGEDARQRTLKTDQQRTRGKVSGKLCR